MTDLILALIMMGTTAALIAHYRATKDAVMAYTAAVSFGMALAAWTTALAPLDTNTLIMLAGNILLICGAAAPIILSLKFSDKYTDKTIHIMIGCSTLTGLAGMALIFTALYQVTHF